jgi:hypothetical protein
MRIRLALILFAFTCGINFIATAAVEFSAGVEISATADFVDPLTPLGTWVNVSSYGRCWHPTRVEADWRPYCEGRWEWTDCGWYWVSDEPWAWACYHYGSWVNVSGQGWFWVPDTEWAPSWVVWRESPDYIGWAPCGPHGIVVAAPLFVFVDVHHFHEPIRSRTVIVNNTTIINRTRVINNIRHDNRHFDGGDRRVVVNEGPGVDPIQRAVGRQITPRPVSEVARQNPAPQNLRHERNGQGNELKPTGNNRNDSSSPNSPGGNQPRVLERQPAQNSTPAQPDQPRRPEHPAEVAPVQPAPPPNRPESKTPTEKHELPPTGKDQPTLPSQPPQRPAPPVPAPEHPIPPTPPHPPQKPLPPTGHDDVIQPQHPPQPPPKTEQHSKPEKPAPKEKEEHPQKDG